ncbi:uncharacterized protein RSE6_10592 [Rhynchosporium secalis]|uniref:2EXR domain-containing protein n=1 Tax=Rhynchosporium secalis TaxID=38038 RepID=A0A1E1MKU9_RHYSE|nr:uncharacterized protein RSE6_10592 [Rhynchosporium secalis]
MKAEVSTLKNFSREENEDLDKICVVSSTKTSNLAVILQLIYAGPGFARQIFNFLEMFPDTSSALSRPSVQDDDAQFTPFPRLPPELRLIVWKAALPGPRVITILPRALAHPVETYEHPLPRSPLVHLQVSTRPGVRELLVPGQTPRLARSNAVSPVLLFVNGESRKVALARYEIAFKTQISSPIYFNFAHDIIYLPNIELVQHFTDPEYWRTIGSQSSQLKHLIIGVRWLWEYIQQCAESIKGTNSLDTLILTVDDIEPHYDGFYFTAKDKVYHFLSDWRITHRHRVFQGRLVEPKVIKFIGLAETRLLAARSNTGMLDLTFDFCRFSAYRNQDIDNLRITYCLWTVTDLDSKVVGSTRKYSGICNLESAGEWCNDGCYRPCRSSLDAKGDVVVPGAKMADYARSCSLELMT